MKKTTLNGPRRKEKPVKRNSRSVQYFLSLPYKIEVLPLKENDGGGYLATIPLLEGCQSDGKTPDEAIENLREAQEAWIRSALKHADPIPLPQ